MNSKTKTFQKINADFAPGGEVVPVTSEVVKIVFPVPKKSARPVEVVPENNHQVAQRTAFKPKKKRIKLARINTATFVVALIVTNSITFTVGSIITSVLNQSRIDIHREL